MKISYKTSAISIALLIAFSITAHDFIFNILAARVSFPKNHVNQVLTMDDGQKYSVLRTLHVKDIKKNTNDYSVLIVKFKFKGLSSNTNKRLSIIPTPFLINMKGFVQKFWTFNTRTNEFQGIYQWKSKKQAESYPDSFVFKLMTKRAAQGTVSYKIIPNTNLNNYIEKLSSNSQL